MSDEEKYEKKVKYTKIFCIILGTLFATGFFINLPQKAYHKVFTSLILIVLLSAMYFLIKKKNIAGPILGIILGIGYIFYAIYGSNIFSLIIGIFVIIDSVTMLKYIKKLRK